MVIEPHEEFQLPASSKYEAIINLFFDQDDWNHDLVDDFIDESDVNGD